MNHWIAVQDMKAKGNKVLFDGGKFKKTPINRSGLVVASTHVTNNAELIELAAVLKKAEGKTVFSCTNNPNQPGPVWIKSHEGNALYSNGF